MVSEITINRLENVLTEVVDFSGTKEQTTIVSNMEVLNASPAGLTGFVTIRDDRDGDTILASKVPGVIYANGDLVNVLFIDGTEPIAFQQASASGGDPVAVSKLVSPDLAIDPVISADNSGDVTLAGTGDLILPDDIIHSGDTNTLISLEDDKIVLQAGGFEMVSIIEAGTDEVVINDGSGNINFRAEGLTDANLFVVRASSDRVGIGTDSPAVKVEVQDEVTTGAGVQFKVLNTATITNSFTVMSMQADNATVVGQLVIDGLGTGAAATPSMLFGPFTSHPLILVTANTDRARIDTSGDMVIGNTAASAQLHVDQPSTTAAQPVLLLDQGDISEEIIWYSGESAAGSADMSLVDAADFTTPGALLGWVKKKIQDNRGGGGLGTIDVWMPFYAIPTA